MENILQNNESTIQLLTERLSEMGYEFISFDSASNKATYRCTRCGTVNTAHKVTINKEFIDNRWKLCSHCQFSNSSLEQLIEKYKEDENSRSLISSIKNCKDYYDQVVQMTEFLGDDVDIKERIYCVVNGIQSIDDIICPICKKHKRKWSKKFWLGYNNTCGGKNCESTFMSNLMLKLGCNSFEKSVENFKKWQSSLTAVNDDIINTITYPAFAEYIDNPILINYLKKRFKDSESLQESIERINWGIEEKPTCAFPGCTNHVKWLGNPHRYHQFCSCTCSNKMKQYGIEHKHVKTETPKVSTPDNKEVTTTVDVKSQSIDLLETVSAIQPEVKQEPDTNTVASETPAQPVEKKTPIVGCDEFKKKKKKSSAKSATTHKPCPYKDFNELYEKADKNAKKVLLYLRNADNLQLLINATPTLPADIEKSMRFYCWREGLTEIPKCPHCGKPRRFEGVSEGFFATCGDKACKSAAVAEANRNRDVDWKEVQRKKEETYAAKHNGIRHNMQDPEACKKFFDDYKAKHNGESCGVQSKKAIENRQKTIDEKYGGNIRNAFEQGLIKKYGSVAEAGRITGQAGLKKMNENKDQFFLDRLDEMGYDFIESIDDDKVKLRCRNCGNEFEILRHNINTLYRSGTFYLCDKCTFENFLEDYLAGDYTTRQFITIVKLWSGYTEAVIQRTLFLNEYNPTIIERLYYIVNDLTEIVNCKYCGKKCAWNSADRLDLGYDITCQSPECIYKHRSIITTGSTVRSENRVKNFQEWQETVTEVNDEIIKENIKYDTLVPYITNPVILEYLENRFTDSDSIEETLARIELGVEEKPECANPKCHNHVVWIGRKRALYTTYCCDSCSARSEETLRKKRETNIKNWGTPGIFDSSVYQQQYYEKTGYNWCTQNPEIKYKIYLGQKRSAMGGTSKMEQRFYKALEDLGYKFEQQYMSEEYPFKCDAYIPALDLYIEYQGWQGHGDHPFDPNNPEDIEQLEAWKRGEERCLEVNRNTRYTCMIDTWTVRDPHKRSFVDKNHLKMLEVFDYKDSHDLQRQIDEYMKKIKPAALF